MLVELTRDNFRSVVGTERVVLIECWSPGCAVCAGFDPIFAAAAGRHPSHVFARMNVATDERLGEFFDVEHTPALMLYRDGLLLFRQPGVFESDELDGMIRQAESLDMALVRADLEAERARDGQPRS